MIESGITGGGEGGARGLQELVEGFRRWRKSRRRGERIPLSLWDEAVQVCQEHALKRVAYRLRVAPASLMRHLERVERIAPKRSALVTEFVEVFMSSTPGPTAEASMPEVPVMPEPRTEFTAPPMASPMASPTHECVVEMENGQGVKMRVQLNGLGLAQLATLCSAMGRVLCPESRSTA